MYHLVYMCPRKGVRVYAPSADRDLIVCVFFGFERSSMVETRAVREAARAASGTRDRDRPLRETVTLGDSVETTVLRSAIDQADPLVTKTK